MKNKWSSQEKFYKCTSQFGVELPLQISSTVDGLVEMGFRLASLKINSLEISKWRIKTEENNTISIMPVVLSCSSLDQI